MEGCGCYCVGWQQDIAYMADNCPIWKVIRSVLWFMLLSGHLHLSLSF